MLRMEEDLSRVHNLMQQQIDLQQNLLINGLIGVNEVRASSQLANKSQTLAFGSLHPSQLPTLDDALARISILKEPSPRYMRPAKQSVKNKTDGQSVLQIGQMTLSPRMDPVRVKTTAGVYAQQSFR